MYTEASSSGRRLQPQHNALRRLALKTISAAALALAGCAEGQSQGRHTPAVASSVEQPIPPTSQTNRDPLPGIDPTSHSFCTLESSDALTQKFRTDIAKLVGNSSICNDSDGGAVGVAAESSYDSTDGSGRFLRITRIEDPEKFAEFQRTANEGNFAQSKLDGHAAIYHQGALTLQADNDTTLVFVSGTYEEGGEAPAKVTGENAEALRQVASDVLPSFS